MTDTTTDSEGRECPNCGVRGTPNGDEDRTYLCVSFDDECRVMLFRAEDDS